MTTDLLAVGAVCLLFGFLTGFLAGRYLRVRRGPPPGGHTGGMAPTPAPSQDPGTRRGSRLARLLARLDRPWFYVLGVFVAIGLSGSALLVGVQAFGRTADQAACIAEYNRDNGDARDERAGVATLDRAAERATWQTLHDQLSAPDGSVTLQDVLATIQARIDSIDSVDETALQNPYPDPDRCK